MDNLKLANKILFIFESDSVSDDIYVYYDIINQTTMYCNMLYYFPNS